MAKRFARIFWAAIELENSWWRAVFFKCKCGVRIYSPTCLYSPKKSRTRQSRSAAGCGPLRALQKKSTGNASQGTFPHR